MTFLFQTLSRHKARQSSLGRQWSRSYPPSTVPPTPAPTSPLDDEVMSTLYHRRTRLFSKYIIYLAYSIIEKQYYIQSLQFFIIMLQFAIQQKAKLQTYLYYPVYVKKLNSMSEP